MLGRTVGLVLVGIDARPVDVEVDLTGGLPTIAAVGLPDSAVREGIDRVRSALQHTGFKLPQKRIVVNLAPAELRKQGAGLDLPIAVALLVADGKLGRLGSRPQAMAGELGLDGSVRPVRGAVSLALAAREAGHRSILLPRANAREGALVDGIDVIPVSSLNDVLALDRGRLLLSPLRCQTRDRLAEESHAGSGPDLAEVRGQSSARRALEVAAAGGHHLLLSGPPGAGKSMLARRLPGILPPLDPDEALEVTRFHSAAGLARTGLIVRRPFRAPHHGISVVGLTGGGPAMRPGEMTLATHGVLYLDELTEFRRDALESLRQPLEDGWITVARVHGSVTFPARFALVASMNPCPCGFHGDPTGRCSCEPPAVRRYRARLSGPLLDRFDLWVEVPAVKLEALAAARAGESSAAVRQRVVTARRRQRARLDGRPAACNAAMGPADLERCAALSHHARRLLLAAGDRFGITGRGYDRVRRVARTLADLEGSAGIEGGHVAEALQYRHADLSPPA